MSVATDVIVLRPGDYCLNCLAQAGLRVVEWESIIGLPTLRGAFCTDCTERGDHEKWLSQLFMPDVDLENSQYQ
jgi:hypothetical protein